MMISYEELCQALDRFNAKRRNEAEMAALDGMADDAGGGEEVAAAAAEAPEQAAAPLFDDIPEAAPMPTDDDEASASDAGFADQSPEDTHEIDVDDMMVDDRLSEGKIPGD
jgi:hypothetical protein